MFNDLKFAFRQLAKSPGFTAVAVLTLALGIGINTLIFSVLNTFFLHPLPVKAPEEIVRCELPLLSFAEYERLRTEMKSLSGLLASNGNFRGLLLQGPESTELITSSAVSGNYFTVLGLTPAAGRFFSEQSSDLAQPIVVISHALWQRRFGGDPNLIGQTITLNFQPVTVVAVAPQGFVGEVRMPSIDSWYPIASQPRAFAGNRREFKLLGRLKSGITPEQAHAELTMIYARPEWQSLGLSRSGALARVVSDEQSRMENGGWLTLLMGPVVGLVLFVACANVSGLLLSRHEERQRELAVRLALGAGQARIIWHLLAEALLLSLLGGIAGLLFTVWGLDAIPSLLPSTFATWLPHPHINQRVLGFTLGLSVFATLAAGLMPARRASRLDVSTMLKTGGGHLGKTPSRSVLVVGQVAIAMVFLAIAALFVRGFLHGINRDLGFSERNVLFVSVTLEPRSMRQSSMTLDEAFDEVRQTVAALPGVRSMTLASSAVGSIRPNQSVLVRSPEDEATGNAAGQSTPGSLIDPGYFATLGIPLLHGRDFTMRDNLTGARVAIVSETMAKRFWPGENPVGKTLFAGRTELAPREVVGVVRDLIDFRAPQAAARPFLYLPLRQERPGDLLLIVKTYPSPSQLVAPIRAALPRMGAAMTTSLFSTMRDGLRMQMLSQWLGAWLGGVLGLLAFVIAISGLYCVVAYAVARRTRELGIRVALGAAPGDTVWLVLRQGLFLAVIGAAIGLPLAIGAGALLRAQLVGISPADPVALAGSTLLVIGIATLASYLPARRATRVNPVEALRAE